jgi:hypothetical protein
MSSCLARRALGWSYYQGRGCLYSPSCREGAFWESGLPAYPILGNWVAGFKYCSEAKGMYVTRALNKSVSDVYHRCTRVAWCPSQKTYWGDRWGKGKEELGTRFIVYIHTAHICTSNTPSVKWFTTEVQRACV